MKTLLIRVIAVFFVVGTSNLHAESLPIADTALLHPINVSPSADLSNLKEKSKVYQVSVKEALVAMASEPDVAPYISNSLGNDGIATGESDPVLMRMMKESLLAMPQPTTNVIENAAAPKTGVSR